MTACPEPCPSDRYPGIVARARQMTVTVISNEPLARDTWRLRLAAPFFAREAKPGQFFMVREPGAVAPLLGRPFALYDTFLDAAGSPAGIDLGYVVVGRMTRLMTTWRAGDAVEIWGPLGNGFPPPVSGSLLLVAGGIGYTPFLAVAREACGERQYGAPPRAARHPARVILCYGARSAEFLAGRQDFDDLHVDVRLATDDGTAGQHGFVTDLIAGALADLAAPGSAAADAPAMFCCGPEPMMHAAARIAARLGVRCWLSLETPMACGFGACFSCVTRVRDDDGGWDYRRTCIEGPVFPADRLEF